MKSGIKCVLTTGCPHCRKYQVDKGWSESRDENALTTQHAQKQDQLSEAWQDSPWLECAIVRGTDSNLPTLSIASLPSTFSSLHLLLIALVPGLAVFFSPVSVCCSCSAKSSRLCLARDRNGLGWAWNLLPPPMHQVVSGVCLGSLHSARAKLSGETPSLCHTAAFVCCLGRERKLQLLVGQ